MTIRVQLYRAACQEQGVKWLEGDVEGLIPGTSFRSIRIVVLYFSIMYFILFYFIGYFPTLSKTRLHRVEWVDDRWTMNWKGFCKKLPCPILGNIPTFARRYWGKRRKTCRDSSCRGRESKSAPDEYEFTASHLHQPVRLMLHTLRRRR
jgi:hypothetical protein